MSLFSKLKDYNVELDEILDSKIFSSNVKNLFLNMVYKIEISYNDFYEVKRCVRTKEDFLNEIVESIRLYCDNIKTVDKNSEEAKRLENDNVRALTNDKERSILTYPTEIDLLYAVSDISPKYFYIDNNYIYKKMLQRILVNGYNDNNVEILKDFNGWSWDSSNTDKMHFMDNVIYQNLLVMLGEKFLYEWRTYGSTRRDFLKEAKDYVKIFTGNESYFEILEKMLYIYCDSEEKSELNSYLKEKRIKLKRMQDKFKFLGDLKERKIKLTKKIEKIDIALNNPKKLKEELEKTNLKLSKENKIKTINKYKELLITEKNKMLDDMKEVTFLSIPSNFLKYKSQLEEEVKICSYKKDLPDTLIDLELEFLNYINKKLLKMKTRDEIIDVIYQLRYFSRIKVDEYTIMSEADILQEKVDEILKIAITKLCKLGAIKIISMDIDLNFEIIKYILDNKIINLEDIKFSIEKKTDGLIIQVFDKDVFEKQGKKKMEVLNDSIEIKNSRKIKLFN